MYLRADTTVYQYLSESIFLRYLSRLVLCNVYLCLPFLVLLFSLFLSLTRKPFICTSVSHEPPEPPYLELPRVYRLMRLSSVACLSLSFFFPFLFVVSAWTSRLDLRFAGRLFGGRCKHSSEPVRCIPYYPVHQCAVVKGFDSSSSFSS